MYSYPTQGHLLGVTFPCSLMGFPPKTLQGKLSGQSAAPPRPLHADHRPLLASRLRPAPQDTGSMLTPLAARSRGSSASVPQRLRQRPLLPSGRPCARLPFAVPPGGPGTPFLLAPSRSPFPPGAHQAPPPQFGSSEPRPPPKSFPAPPLLPGGYSLKPLRISLARSSLADMMRRLPPAALPRWLGGASQTVPRNRGRSRSPAGHLRQAAVAARPEPASPSPKLPLLIPSPSL